MAGKSKASRAESKVTEAKKKNTSSAGVSKAKNKGTAKSEKNIRKDTVKETGNGATIPASTVTALISLALFILFLVIAVNPDGVLLQFVQSIVLGLLGKAGFYFAIPGLLYLFVLNTFLRKKSAGMRSACVVIFVFACGCVYHLSMPTAFMDQGLALIPDLFRGGVDGSTGGILCGGFAMFLRWSCGKPISYLILILTIMLTLLGSLQITVPSIIRAIINRPRDDWDDEEDYIEPAAIVVNHIANKKIEQKRQRREKERMNRAAMPDPYDDFEEEELPPPPPAAARIKERKANPQPVETPAEVQNQPMVQQSEPVRQNSGKGASFMNRVDMDINAPLPGTASHIKEEIPNVFDEPVQNQVSASVKTQDTEPAIPKKMPELKKSEKIPNGPVLSQEQKTSVPKKEEDPEKVTAKDAARSAKQVAAEIAKNEAVVKAEYCFPPIDLLKKPARGGGDGTDEMRENSRRLNETLASFKIDAHIINVTRGPSVTRYEVELDKGVRLNKLTGCADDIALSLGASGVRIAAVPGKISVVGIEVPNKIVTTVSLREVIDSQEFNRSKSKSSFAVGKDIGGSCIIGNIAKMPHLLIAGTTGSGKSVCMNSIIISLLYKAGPEDVKLIMVDPKMVELGIYNNIPHLLIPVVTDPKKAAGSLQWAVTEMLRRYKMMSDAGVRDLESYNSIMLSEEGQKLPQVVIIIDELADLMMVAAKEVEDSICRIAQMGRAAGMHLIIATQRPSADVITGLMKANIPSRIAFSVASAMESRIILDTMGAEKLVGKGDMLFAPIGSGKPLRVQGCFVTDAEVEAVAEYVKENYVADYNQQVLEEIEKKAMQTGSKKPATASDPDPSDEELEGDEMLPQAVDVILETGQASVSMLQRRLKLGYARAARIVDEMEEKGIVGPFQGSKPRAILITKEQWQSMQGGNPQMDFDELEDYGVTQQPE